MRHQGKLTFLFTIFFFRKPILSRSHKQTTKPEKSQQAAKSEVNTQRSENQFRRTEPDFNKKL